MFAVCTEAKWHSLSVSNTQTKSHISLGKYFWWFCLSLSPLFVLCRATAPGDKCCAARQREKRDGRRFIAGQRSRVEEGEQPLKQKRKRRKTGNSRESNSGRQELRRRSLSRDKRPDGGYSGGTTEARASQHQPTSHSFKLLKTTEKRNKNNWTWKGAKENDRSLVLWLCHTTDVRQLSCCARRMGSPSQRPAVEAVNQRAESTEEEEEELDEKVTVYVQCRPRTTTRRRNQLNRVQCGPAEAAANQ